MRTATLLRSQVVSTGFAVPVWRRLSDKLNKWKYRGLSRREMCICSMVSSMASGTATQTHRKAKKKWQRRGTKTRTGCKTCTFPPHRSIRQTRLTDHRQVRSSYRMIGSSKARSNERLESDVSSAEKRSPDAHAVRKLDLIVMAMHQLQGP